MLYRNKEKPMNLNDTMERVATINREKGFTDHWDDAEKLLLMHSEISEAAEALREGIPPAAILIKDETNGGKPEGVPIELADTIIRILHFCSHHGIDIESAIQMKLAYNETRPYKHGRKF